MFYIINTQLRQHKMKNLKNILKQRQTADNISQVCCPHVELNMLSSYGKNTKH